MSARNLGTVAIGNMANVDMTLPRYEKLPPTLCISRLLLLAPLFMLFRCRSPYANFRVSICALFCTAFRH